MILFSGFASGTIAGGPLEPTQVRLLCCIQVPGDFSQEGSPSPELKRPSIDHGEFQCQLTLAYNLGLEIRAPLWVRIDEASGAAILDSAFLSRLISPWPALAPYSSEQNTLKKNSTINCTICARDCVRNFMFISSISVAVLEACRCGYPDFPVEEPEFQEH